MTPTNKLLAAIALLGTVLFIRKNKPTAPMGGIGALPKTKLFTGTYEEFIYKSLLDSHFKDYIYMNVPELKRKQIKKLTDIDVKKFVLYADYVRHVNKRHKKDTEKGLFFYLPELLQYGIVETEIYTSKPNLQCIKFVGTIKSERTVSVWVETIRDLNEPDNMMMVSLHIKR